MVTRYQRYVTVALALLAAGIGGAGTALAQAANYAPITLSANPATATVTGVTAGIFSLANIAMRDQRSLICAGFADATPDHILTLTEPLSQITLQVDSGGHDTSLLLQGPGNGQVYCDEDISRRNPDAQIQAENLPAGTYRLWVGSQDHGERINYSLIVTP